MMRIQWSLSEHQCQHSSEEDGGYESFRHNAEHCLFASGTAGRLRPPAGNSQGRFKALTAGSGASAIFRRKQLAAHFHRRDVPAVPHSA